MSAAKAGHPSGAAPAWLGVARTGPSTAKSAPTATAACNSRALWHEAANQRSAGTGLLRHCSKAVALR